MTEIIPFDAEKDWPEPDMNLGKPARPSAPCLREQEVSMIFGPWADWLRSAAEVKGAPLDYVALGLLTIASACIGNSRWVSPWNGWKEPPILWGMLVGDPSAGKSPALDAILDGVKELELELTAEYTKQRKEWDDKDEVAKLVLAQWKVDAKKEIANGGEPQEKPEDADAGKPPVRERVRIADATIEKVADLLSASWRGLVMCRDELSGWLANMERYSSGADRPFWLEAYGGRSYVIDRKANPEPVVVDHLSVSVLGGTQPDKLDRLLIDTDDDGLLARFLTVWPEPVPLNRPESLLNDVSLIEGLKRLRSLSGTQDDTGNLRPFYLHLTAPAQAVFQEFRKPCREWEVEAEGLYKGHIGKLGGMVLRVACVLAHLDYAWAGEDMPTAIDENHIARACHLVGEHYRKHAYRTYGCVKAHSEITDADKAAAFILKSTEGRVYVRQVQRSVMRKSKSSQVSQALSVLEEAGWVRKFTIETVGRPQVIYTINPKLQRQQGKAGSANSNTPVTEVTKVTEGSGE